MCTVQPLVYAPSILTYGHGMQGCILVNVGYVCMYEVASYNPIHDICQ